MNFLVNRTFRRATMRDSTCENLVHSRQKILTDSESAHRDDNFGELIGSKKLLIRIRALARAQIAYRALAASSPRNAIEFVLLITWSVFNKLT